MRTELSASRHRLPALLSYSAAMSTRAGRESHEESGAQARTPAALARLPPGATAGRYVVLECLGVTDRGTRYVARDPDLGRKVALEVLHVDVPAGLAGEARESLLRQAQAAARLSHRGRTTIYDVGTVGDDVFLATELVDEDAGSARNGLPLPVGVIAGAAVLLLGAVVVALIPWHAAASAASASPPRPTSVVDVPLPPSTSPEALAAYQQGLQGMRDGTWQADAFERATELDPSLAAAHLRYAMLQFWQFPTEGREHLAKAVENRARLTERDQAILRAAQAWMQTQPSDDVAFVRLLDAAQARYPMDAEIAYYAGFAETQLADHVASVARLDRAIALDPGFAAAYQCKSDEQAYAGDLEGALATLDTCVSEAPDATRCLMERGFLDTADGRCDELEADAQRMRAHDPRTDMAYWMLAYAAYAQGQPVETVAELLHEQERHVAPGVARRYALKHRYELAALQGDFDEAIRAAEGLVAATVATPDRRLRAGPALLLIAARLESGQTSEAAAIAHDFLNREQAWAPEPRSDDFAVLRDSMPRFWIAERRAGVLSAADFETARHGWIQGWKARLPPGYVPFAWLHGYARIVETAADAEQALAVQPAFGPIPLFTPLTFGDAFVGKTYALAGRFAEALPYLRRATRSCRAVDHPFEHTEAHLLLGQAAAAVGEVDEACAAYAVVLSRWGSARPRSVTAERARELSRALACP